MDWIRTGRKGTFTIYDKGRIRTGRKVPFTIYDNGAAVMSADVILYDDGTGEGVVRVSVLRRFTAGRKIRIKTKPEIAIWLNTGS